jgi:hypothetical protein
MWNQVALEGGLAAEWAFPSVRIWVYGSGRTWHTAIERRPARVPVIRIARKPPEGLSWDETIAGESGSVRAEPKLSDRPIAAQIGERLKLARGASADFTILLPLDASLILDDKTELASYPLQRRSGTWYGEMHAGVHCYSLKAEPLDAIATKRFAERPDPSVAACAIRLENDTSEPIDVKTIPVPVDWLSLWSSRTLVATDGLVYRWEARDGLEVTLSESAPRLADDLDFVSGPRKHEKRRFFEKGFSFVLNAMGGRL